MGIMDAPSVVAARAKAPKPPEQNLTPNQAYVSRSHARGQSTAQSFGDASVVPVVPTTREEFAQALSAKMGRVYAEDAQGNYMSAPAGATLRPEFLQSQVNQRAVAEAVVSQQRGLEGGKATGVTAFEQMYDYPYGAAQSRSISELQALQALNRPQLSPEIQSQVREQQSRTVIQQTRQPEPQPVKELRYTPEQAAEELSKRGLLDVKYVQEIQGYKNVPSQLMAGLITKPQGKPYEIKINQGAFFDFQSDKAVLKHELIHAMGGGEFAAYLGQINPFSKGFSQAEVNLMISKASANKKVTPDFIKPEVSTLQNIVLPTEKQAGGTISALTPLSFSGQKMQIKPTWKEQIATSDNPLVQGVLGFSKIVYSEEKAMAQPFIESYKEVASGGVAPPTIAEQRAFWKENPMMAIGHNKYPKTQELGTAVSLIGLGGAVAGAYAAPL
jgi:hypothetical protein